MIMVQTFFSNLFSPFQVHGQIIYAWTLDDIFIKIDVANCTVCKVGQFNNAGNGDLVVMPDGTVLTSGAANQILIYTPPDPNLSLSVSGPGNHYYYTMSEPLNGIVYVYTSIIGPGITGITAYDPVAGTLTYVGNFPNNWSLGGMWVENGMLYATALIGSTWTIIEINLSNPALSTILLQGNMPLQNGSLGGDVCSGVYTTAVHNHREILYQYDPATNDITLLCNFLNVGYINQIRGLSVSPPGLPEFPCLCVTFAGILDSTPKNPCIPASVSVSALTAPVLDSGDGVRYILFSDINDTLGSVLQTNTAPVFTYNPAVMQANVTYYGAIMVGPLLPNGTIDTEAPCFDVSNAVSITWREKPAVSLSIVNPNACAGECFTLEASFTGTSPFELKVDDPFAGLQTYTFASATGSFEVCAPFGTPMGGWNVEAVSVKDLFCTCQ